MSKSYCLQRHSDRPCMQDCCLEVGCQPLYYASALTLRYPESLFMHLFSQTANLPSPLSPMSEPEFQLREAAPGDAPALRDIAIRTFVETFGSEFAPQRLDAYVAEVYEVAKVRREIEDDRSYTVLLFHESKPELPCGYATLQSGSVRPGDTGPQEDYLELQRFYVDKDFHGRGCAYIMMKHLVTIIQQKQPRIAWLIVWGDNVRATRFYNKFGFVQTGQQPSKLGNGQDLIMSLQ